MYGMHAAEVEVDVEAGVVRVLKIAAAHDLGLAINPMTCEKQNRVYVDTRINISRQGRRKIYGH